MKKIILSLLTLSVLTFTACNTGSGGDPKEVLIHFFDALAKKDIEEAKKYVTKDSEGMLGMIQMGMNSVPDSASNMYKKENVNFGNVKIDGDKATVTVTDKISNESNDFILKKEDGAWKVAFDKSTLMEMAQKKMKEKNIDADINGAMDSLQKGMENMSEEELKNVQKMMDSASKVFEKMNDNGQLDKAKEMLENMQKNAQ